MIDAYLDESGIHDGAAICVIAGFFSGRGQWRAFERDWRKMLHRFDVPMEEVHAKDLIPKRQGFFLKLRDTRHDPEELLNQMAETVARHTVYPVAAGVIVRGFYSFSLEQRRFLVTGATLKDGKLITTGSPNKPYFARFQWCVRTVACYAPAHDRVSPANGR